MSNYLINKLSEMFKVGTVTHFYDKLSTAIILLDNTLSVGDRIKFVKKGENVFEQKVESLQIGHQKTDSAKRGSMVALKTNETVDTETEVFKI